MTNPIERVPPGAWLFAALGVGLAALVWHRYCLDPEDRDWLDPGQPPINLDLNTRATTMGAPLGPWRAPKTYMWATLMASPDCWVGDC